MSNSRNDKPDGFLIRLAPQTQLDDEKAEIHFNYVYYVKPPERRSMTFKGGGVRVFVYQKFLEIAHEMGLLAQLKELGGSSSGSIAAIFGSIHFETATARKAVFDELNQLPYLDTMGDTQGWEFYKKASQPLKIVSKPLSAVSSALHWFGDKCNKINPGKVLGYPLKAGASLVGGLGKLVSPEGFAGVYNWMTTGAIYRNKVHLAVREYIQSSVQAGIDAILSQITNPLELQATQLHLQQIGLCVMQDDQLKVMNDITFKHFYALSQIPGSQFKKIFITALRIKDKQLVILNHQNSPNMPVYEALGLAMALPLFYGAKYYENVKYGDGGIVDNSPARHATPHGVLPIHEKHGLTDHHSRFIVRVEYPDDLDNLLWRAPKPITGIKKTLGSLKAKVLQRFTYGVDSYQTNAETNLAIQNDYAHNTLQMEDFHLPRLANLTPEQRAELSELSAERVYEYFFNHEDEVAVIQHYPPPTDEVSPQTMPVELISELLEMLEDKETYPTDTLFDVPLTKQFSEVELARLEALRQQEIVRIRALRVLSREDSTLADIWKSIRCSSPAPQVETVAEVESLLSDMLDTLDEVQANEEDLSPRLR